jgi:hypothetical protein
MELVASALEKTKQMKKLVLIAWALAGFALSGFSGSVVPSSGGGWMLLDDFGRQVGIVAKDGNGGLTIHDMSGGQLGYGVWNGTNHCWYLYSQSGQEWGTIDSQ